METAFMSNSTKLRHHACELFRDLLNSLLTKSAVAVNVGFIAASGCLPDSWDCLHGNWGCLAGW